LGLEEQVREIIHKESAGRKILLVFKGLEI